MTDNSGTYHEGGMLRILHLRDSERLCGPGKIIRDCIRANPDPRITFRLAAFGPVDRNGLLLALSRLVPVNGLPARRRDLWRAAREAERIVRAEHVDLIHAHDFKANVVGLVAARRAGIPIVSTSHGKIPISAKARLYCALDGQLLRRMDLVFAVSAMMARQLHGEGVPGNRLVMARNGIMLSEHPFGHRSDTLLREGVLQAGEIAIGHVGRVSPEKGVVPLVKTFARIAAAYPEAKLVIAGDGPDIERARHAAAERSLNGRIVFLGYPRTSPISTGRWISSCSTRRPRACPTPSSRRWPSGCPSSRRPSEERRRWCTTATPAS